MSVNDFMLEIINKLNKATEAYESGQPIMTDKEWDDLYFDLVQKEKISGYSLEKSPTNFIINPFVSALEKIEHNHPMLSLDKTKDITEVLDFLSGNKTIALCKMDGLTCSLKYVNGRLVSAETRGDGSIGENILHNAQGIQSIPNHINYHKELIIDGEIICTYQNFEKFNSEYKNPRNFAAGSIRLLDGLECKKRNLTFVAWDVIKGLDQHISHYNSSLEEWDEKHFFENNEENNCLSDKLHDLAKLGFTIAPYHCVSKEEISLERLEFEVDSLKIKAKDFSYPIDGIVFKFDNIEYGKSLGKTAHHFNNALAYKFYDETFETRLLDISYDVSRNGILTPVAVFEPIEIEGSEISRASLHNLSVMEELLGKVPFKGQLLEIYRANMIIPQVLKSIKLDEMVEPVPISNTIELPSTCPICGHELYISESDSGIHTLTCVNYHCEGRLVNRLDHFCGKKGLDIKGLSVATLEKLVDWGWVETIEDIFNLKNHAQEWKNKEGFGEKSVTNILNSIEKAKTCELYSFIAALGIPFIGQQVAKDLCDYVYDYADFRDRIYDGWNFASIPSFGQVKMQSILEFNYTEADNIARLLTISNTKEEKTSGLDNQTFVITGKLKNFKNRALLKNEIEMRGGKVTDSVTSKTNFLINNDKDSTSSKNTKAKELNIPIISEEEFLEMIK